MAQAVSPDNMLSAANFSTTVELRDRQGQFLGRAFPLTDREERQVARAYRSGLGNRQSTRSLSIATCAG